MTTSLLVRPDRAWDEGPSGYRLRLASANCLLVRDLKDLEVIGEVDAMSAHRGKPEAGAGYFDPWVRQFSRFCPSCLETRRIWLIGWELLFADACPICGSWLVDACSACSENLNWHRAQTHKCDCGQYLGSESFSSAPHSVVKLSRALQNVALELASPDLPVFDGLSLEQCGRLVKLFGSYGNGDGGRLPQKISQLDTLKVSWPITTMAAEILDSWPSGFWRLLDNLRHQSSASPQGKLTTAFRGFYSALYKGFRDSEFNNLRTEFENYLSQHWTGAIGRRNRRIAETVLKTMAWMPANHACRLLSVSRRRLNDLIEEGRLQGEQRLTSGNRKFIVVRRSDVEQLVATLDNGVALADAALRLGFSRQRLLALMPIICPQAKKLGAQGCPWAIPVTWVERWETLIRSQISVELIDSQTVAFGHLLRYWPWTNDQIGSLLIDIYSAEIVPVGSLERAGGISSLVLNLDRVKQWFSGKQHVPCVEIAIPDVAIRLGIKQEVAYALVRSGLLHATLRKVGRRPEKRVKVTTLEDFERGHILGRDVARLLGRSPRAIADFLLANGVMPVAGPGIDTCRQTVFKRVEVYDWLHRNGLEMPALTS